MMRSRNAGFARRSLRTLVLVVSAGALALAGEATAADGAEAAARAIAEAFRTACEKADVAGVVALYDDRATAIFAGAGQEAKGKLNLARLVAGTCRPGVKLKMTDLEVYSLGDDYIATAGRWEVQSPGPDGKPATVKLRTSEVLGKKDGKWRYLIDHASVGAPPAPAAPRPASTAASDAAGAAAKDSPAAAKPGAEGAPPAKPE